MALHNFKVEFLDANGVTSFETEVLARFPVAAIARVCLAEDKREAYIVERLHYPSVEVVTDHPGHPDLMVRAYRADAVFPEVHVPERSTLGRLK